MKRFLLILFIGLFIAGCSVKNRVLILDEYSTYPKVTDKMVRKVAINNIVDNRENKNYIATTKDKDGMVKDYVILSQDLSNWYKKSLIKELESMGVSVVNDDLAAQININIAKFDGNLQGFGKENLTATAEVFIEIKQGKTTIKKRVAQTQSEFTPILNGSAFDPFMKDLLRDIVIKTAKEIHSSL